MAASGLHLFAGADIFRLGARNRSCGLRLSGPLPMSNSVASADSLQWLVPGLLPDFCEERPRPEDPDPYSRLSGRIRSYSTFQSFVGSLAYGRGEWYTRQLHPRHALVDADFRGDRSVAVFRGWLQSLVRTLEDGLVCKQFSWTGRLWPMPTARQNAARQTLVSKERPKGIGADLVVNAGPITHVRLDQSNWQ